MHTISRRNFLQGSLAAGLAGATAGCAGPWHKVNLICTGMMGFLCEPAHGSIRILIPRTRMEGGPPLHAVRFGNVGGANLPRGNYELVLPGFNATPACWPGIQDRASHVVFPKDNAGSCPLRLNPGQMHATIRVPMPTGVDFTRVVRMNPADAAAGKRFFSGDAYQFNINPASFPSVYVLSYESVAGDAGLIAKGDPARKLLTATKKNGLLNLHLYCERAADLPCGDHIGLFNNMFQRADGHTLALAHDDRQDAQGYAKPASEDYVPDDLSVEDIKSLSELGITEGGQPVQCTPPALERPSVMITDLAGCVNGWIDSGF